MVEINDKIGGLDSKSVHVQSFDSLPWPDLGLVGSRV